MLIYYVFCGIYAQFLLQWKKQLSNIHFLNIFIFFYLVFQSKFQILRHIMLLDFNSHELNSVANIIYSNEKVLLVNMINWFYFMLRNSIIIRLGTFKIWFFYLKAESLKGALLLQVHVSKFLISYIKNVLTLNFNRFIISFKYKLRSCIYNMNKNFANYFNFL